MKVYLVKVDEHEEEYIHGIYSKKGLAEYQVDKLNNSGENTFVEWCRNEYARFAEFELIEE